MSKPAKTADVFERIASEAEAPETPEPDAQVADLDVAADDAGDDADPEAPAAEAGMPARRWRVVGALGAAGLVLLAGLSGFLGWRVLAAEQIADASRAALEAAKQYAVILTTLNANDIDTNYRQALDGATGTFKEDYSQGSTHLRQLLIDNKAAGKGVVLDGAVKSATKTRVEVLLFVDQSISNAVLPQPRIDQNRVQMTMELVDGRWLASQVDII